MLTDTPRWSHARDNEVVPSPWQATPVKRRNRRRNPNVSQGHEQVTRLDEARVINAFCVYPKVFGWQVTTKVQQCDVVAPCETDECSTPERRAAAHRSRWTTTLCRCQLPSAAVRGRPVAQFAVAVSLEVLRLALRMP